MPQRRQTLLRALSHGLGLLPLALIVLDARLGQLTANPLQELILRTGKFALVFLTASLAVTPLVTVLGWRRITPLRRTAGLYAFLYALLHVLSFAWLDYDLDLALIAAEVAEKRYIVVGFAAFAILLPLALTSTKGWQRRLGRRWKRVHRGVYLAAGLVVLHYAWSVKSDLRQPLAWAGLVAALLTLRLPAVRRWISARRSARKETGTGQRRPPGPSSQDRQVE